MKVNGKTDSNFFPTGLPENISRELDEAGFRLLIHYKEPMDLVSGMVSILPFGGYSCKDSRKNYHEKVCVLRYPPERLVEELTEELLYFELKLARLAYLDYACIVVEKGVSDFTSFLSQKFPTRADQLMETLFGVLTKYKIDFHFIQNRNEFPFLMKNILKYWYFFHIYKKEGK